MILIKIAHQILNRALELIITIIYKNISRNFFVRYINLEKENKRREFMNKQLAQYGVKYKRINAYRYEPCYHVDEFVEKIISRGIEPLFFQKDDLKKRLPGVVGCYISHIKAIMDIDENDQRYQFILEDDVLIRSLRFFLVARKIVNKLPENWDICLFDPYGNWKKRIDRLFIHYPNECWPEYHGTHAVLINGKRKNKILAELEKISIIDYDCILTGNKTAINTYVVHTGYCEQLFDVFNSDIFV